MPNAVKAMVQSYPTPPKVRADLGRGLMVDGVHKPMGDVAYLLSPKDLAAIHGKDHGN